MVQMCYRGVWDIHINKELRGRLGKERGGKEMDGCPLIVLSSKTCRPE
jgi:hypothetical protein